MKIGIIVNKKNIDGTIILLPIIKEIKDIKKDSIIKVGYSEKFAKHYHLIEFNNKKNKYLIKLSSITTPEQVLELKEQAVFVDENDMIFESDHKFRYYNYKVINTNDNSIIGNVSDYYQLPANDVLVVKNQNKEYLIPMIDIIVKEINEKNNFIKILPLDGLLEDDRAIEI